jgi:hypothetical protein
VHAGVFEVVLRTRTLVMMLLWLVPAAALAQSTGITNADVIRMVEAGLSDEIVLASIAGAARTSFDTSTDGLIELKTAGLSDRVILAIQAHASESASSSPVPAATAPRASSAPVSSTDRGNARSITSRGFGGTVQGSLASGDQRLAGDGAFMDAYVFEGQADEKVTIEVRSSAFAPAVAIYRTSDGGELAAVSGPADALLELDLPADDLFYVAVTSIGAETTGDYTLRTHSALRAAQPSTLSGSGEVEYRPRGAVEFHPYADPTYEIISGAAIASNALRFFASGNETATIQGKTYVKVRVRSGTSPDRAGWVPRDSVDVVGGSPAPSSPAPREYFVRESLEFHKYLEPTYQVISREDISSGGLRLFGGETATMQGRQYMKVTVRGTSWALVGWVPADSLSTSRATFEPPSATASAGRITAGTNVIVKGYQIKLGKDAEYGRVLGMVRRALMRSTRPQAKQQLASWKVAKTPARQSGAGSTWVHIYDDVPGADYSLVNIVLENASQQEMTEFYDLYRGALERAVFDVSGAAATQLLRDLDIEPAGSAPLQRFEAGATPPPATAGSAGPSSGSPAVAARSSGPTAVAAPTASPTLSGACPRGRTVTVENESYCLVREVGYPIVGRYEYEGNGEPIVVLNADGTGLFQRHGVAPIPIEWGIQADAAGAPMKDQRGNGDLVFRLFYLELEGRRLGNGRVIPPSGWDIVELTVDPNQRKIDILRERVKTY